MNSSSPAYIDSHAHMDIMDKADGGLFGVLERMRAMNTRVISIGTQKEDWPIIAELSKKHPELVAYTVGLHPGEVKVDWRKHISALEEILSNASNLRPTPAPPSGRE